MLYIFLCFNAFYRSKEKVEWVTLYSRVGIPKEGPNQTLNLI